VELEQVRSTSEERENWFFSNQPNESVGVSLGGAVPIPASGESSPIWKIWDFIVFKNFRIKGLPRFGYHYPTLFIDVFRGVI
jgi:hypothetical protein